MIKFTVHGEPVAQGRPRFSRQNDKVRTYDPGKSRDYKTLIAYVASQHKPNTPLEGQLVLELAVYRSIPKSFSKKKRQEALEGSLRPITKPDIDNYLKGAKDALNGLLWRDDSQVVTVTASKFYSDNPRIEITLYPL